MLSLLYQAEREAAASGVYGRSREELSALMQQRMTFGCIFPVMFTSLLLQERQAAGGNTGGAAQELRARAERDRCQVLEFTGGYELCGLLRSCIPSMCLQLLSRVLGQRTPEERQEIERQQRGWRTKRR